MAGATSGAAKFSPLDWLRILFALGVITLGPSLLFAYFIGTVPAYEHTGWFGRLLLSIPAMLVCALVTWPLVWLVCRRSVVFPLAKLFAVIYTPISAFMLVGVVNVAFDREPGRVVTVRYVRFEDRHKGTDQDVVTSWHDPSSTISISATVLRQEDRVAGAPVSIRVHEGGLGLEWVSRAGSL